MNRQALFGHFADAYGAEAQYLWQRFPDYAVFRAPNHKWFALYLPRVSAAGLGMAGEGEYGVLNVKAAPADVAALSLLPCIRPAYHMNKAHWVSVLLDEADDSLLRELIAASYALVNPTRRAKPGKS